MTHRSYEMKLCLIVAALDDVVDSAVPYHTQTQLLESVPDKIEMWIKSKVHSENRANVIISTKELAGDSVQ